MRFIVDVCKDHPDLQIMYGIGHERDLTESTLDHLSGYGGAQPVRIGNGAFDQRQNDVWGALLDSIYLHEKALQRARHAGRPAADPLPGGGGDRRLARARPGDLGVARRAPALRLLEADDLGRGRPRRPPRRGIGFDDLADEWQAKADEIKAEILERGVRDGVFRQHYETDALDASLLLIPLFRFLPPDDPRVVATVERDRRGPDRTRPRPPLQGPGDRRRAARQGGHLPDLLLLAGLGALGDRRVRAGPRTLRASARGGRLARPLRRGARRRVRPPPRQLPPGLHPPGADQRGLPRDRRRAARRRRRHRRLQRNGRRPRGRLARFRHPLSAEILRRQKLYRQNFRLLYIAQAAMTNLNRSDDNDLLLALRHPLRRDILREMVGKEGISPREVCRRSAPAAEQRQLPRPSPRRLRRRQRWSAPSRCGARCSTST